jgi:predicted Rossmann fold nucleotide-binding protein DprA/Smf involved in DNA uptake
MDQKRKMLISLLPSSLEVYKPLLESWDLSTKEIERLLIKQLSATHVKERLKSLENWHMCFYGEKNYPIGLYRCPRPPYRILSDKPLAPNIAPFALSGCHFPYDEADEASLGLSYSLCVNGQILATSGYGRCGWNVMKMASQTGTQCLRVVAKGLDSTIKRRWVTTISPFEPQVEPMKNYAGLQVIGLLTGISQSLIIFQAQKNSPSYHAAIAALDIGENVYVHCCGVDARQKCSGSKLLFDSGAPLITSYKDLATFEHQACTYRVRKKGDLWEKEAFT